MAYNNSSKIFRFITLPVLISLFSFTNLYSQTADILCKFKEGAELTFKHKLYNIAYGMATQDQVFTEFDQFQKVTVKKINTDSIKKIRIFNLLITNSGIVIKYTLRGKRDTIQIFNEKKDSITEKFDNNYRDGYNRIKGWIFPDTSANWSQFGFPRLNQPLYKYPYFFRYYTLNGVDTFSFKEKSMLFYTLIEEFDISFSRSYFIHEINGIAQYQARRYSAFDATSMETYELFDPSSDIKETTSLPEKSKLSQNYPNPFNPGTEINFQITHSGTVSLKVFNVLGKEIETLVNEQRPAGVYKVLFIPKNLASGIYFYKLRANGISEIKKMIYCK